MFGKSGFVKRVNRAVDAALADGEERRAAVYLRGHGGNPLAVALFGPSVTDSFILAASQDRLLVLQMGKISAASSSLITSFPLRDVQVTALTLTGLSPRLTMTITFDGAPREVALNVVPAWKKEAAELADVLGWTAPTG